MNKIGQEPESAHDLATNVPAGTSTVEALPTKTEQPPSTNQQWDSAAEEEWNEHSATAWALAYVIHRIRSTPYPPILLPEQRDHFQKVIEMAAALMEEWQRRERDQAQQLAQARPIAELSLEALETIPDSLDGNAVEVWEKQLFTQPYQLPLADDEDNTPAETPRAKGIPAADDEYQI
jgi:hypothetical protein